MAVRVRGGPNRLLATLLLGRGEEAPIGGGVLATLP